MLFLKEVLSHEIIEQVLGAILLIGISFNAQNPVKHVEVFPGLGWQNEFVFLFGLIGGAVKVVSDSDDVVFDIIFCEVIIAEGVDGLSVVDIDNNVS